jgi:acetylornithine deacetylase/succinyl-diaminopimelate desuccinylase-like protein
MGFRVLALLLWLAGLVSAQVSPAVAARQWREMHERSILEQFVDLLRIPNAGQDPAAMRRNAEAISNMFARRGVETRLIEVNGAPPFVYGERRAEGATRTLVFYAHYDGHAVDPSAWNTGDPFKPTLMSGPLETGGQAIPLPRPGWPSDPEWRIYARSAADDKAAILAMAVALEALQNRGAAIHSNLKFFFEGEEERDSPNLVQTIAEHQDLLAGDVWFVCDGPLHQNRQQQIIFGARGIVGLDLTVYGPRRALDSGDYGNWSPNPAMMLAELLASFKDEDGRVSVQGFYDDVLPLEKADLQAIEEAPDYGATLKRELWLPEPAQKYLRLEAALSMPSLNLRSLTAGTAGAQAKDMIPATATASLDVRLVKGMDHARTVGRLIGHIRKQGYFVTETEPGEDIRLANRKVCKVSRRGGYNAAKTPLDSELAQRVISAVERARGPVIKLPTMGGSLPLYAVEKTLGAKVVIVPIANHDSNQHGANENLRLQNLWDGIETMAALIALEEGPATPTGTPKPSPATSR